MYVNAIIGVFGLHGEEEVLHAANLSLPFPAKFNAMFPKKYDIFYLHVCLSKNSPLFQFFK